MNHRSLLPFLLSGIMLPVAALAGLATDWETMQHSPAQIEVARMHPGPLVESKETAGWDKVPATLRKYGAVIYLPSDKFDGVADITVTGDGYLFLACNYDYQGNTLGGWSGDAWDEKKFKSHGWHVLSKHELDGDFVKVNGRAQKVFCLQVHKGETLHLRCNKYDPPYPILVGTKAPGAK
jgi:hypothetical protein